MTSIKIIPFVLLIMVHQIGIGQTSKNDSSTESIILFVCEHGAAKSTIAAAYFNKMAKEKNIMYKAIFRGTTPDTVLSPGATQGLLNDGFNTQGWQPQRVTVNDINNASAIITFDCNVEVGEKTKNFLYRWNDLPPVSQDYQAARDQIIERITLLIKELERRKQQ